MHNGLEQLEQDVRQAQQAVAEATGTAFAGAELVEATVSGDGRLVGLTLDARAYREFAPEDLAAEIVKAVEEARADALDVAFGIVTRRLPALGTPVDGDPLFGPLLAEVRAPAVRRGPEDRR